MTIEQLKKELASLITAAYVSGNYSASYESITGLLNKVTKQIRLDTGDYSQDTLSFFDWESQDYGEFQEEYFENIIGPRDYAALNGTDYASLGNYNGEFLKPAYSKTLPTKVFPQTVPTNKIERACLDANSFSECINGILRKFYESVLVWKFGVKKELLGEFVDAVLNVKASATKVGTEANNPVQYHASSTTTAVAKALVLGDRYYIGASITAATKIGVCVKARIPASKTWKEQIEEGYIVELNLETEVAPITDATTADAFIEAVKLKVADASFVNENSLNGGCLGVNDLVLIVTKDILPKLQVKSYAGAFNKGELAFDLGTGAKVDIAVVDDIPSTVDSSKKVLAVLTDKRSCRVCPVYEGVRAQEVASKNQINYFNHITLHTAYSRNTFVHVFRKNA